MATKNLLQAIHEGLVEEMCATSRYGARRGRAGPCVFRVTQGLQEEFGGHEGDGHAAGRD